MRDCADGIGGYRAGPDCLGIGPAEVYGGCFGECRC